jgi:hypothetical protein
LKSFTYFSVFIVLIFTLSVLSVQDASAATFTAVQSGDWNDPATWGGAVPEDSDDKIIPAGITVTISTGISNSGTIINNPSGIITINSFINNNSGGSIDNGGTITNYGTITNWDTITNSGTIDNNNFIQNPGTINNNSDFNNNPSGIIDNSGTIINDSSFINGGTINNYGDGITNNSSFINNGIIYNYGTINNNSDFTNDNVINNYCNALYSGNDLIGNPANYIGCEGDYAHIPDAIYWTYDGYPYASSSPPFLISGTLVGNIWNDLPLSILVDATDEGDFTINGVIDTIDVVVSSVDDSDVTYTLTETGPNDGVFTGTNFVFLQANNKFQTTDIVNLIYTVDDSLSGCGTDNIITQFDSRSGGPDNGFKVYSNTDPNGVGLVLTETGENTCTFEGQVKFTTTGTTDETTGTLQVSEGDILAFYDFYDYKLYNAQIVPTVAGKGSIIAHFDNPDDENTAEVSVTYHELYAGLDLNDDGAPGAGSGGPVIKPGLVLNFIAALFGGGSTQSVPPTLGLDENQKRIVDEGFSFNGNPVDVNLFYTPYPLITTPVGQNNTIKLKIYENRGPDNIAHVGLSYGLGKGETFNEGRATIEFDRTFDGIESVTLFDPKHVLGSVNVTTAEISCSVHNNAKCLEVTFDHVFRESLEYNMVATNIWDFQRNGWQNYFNHGIQIEGESMNPPEQYSGIYHGHTYSLTETGKNTAIDDDRNSWTFDKTWNRDYIKPILADSNILNSDKIYALEKLGFGYSDGQEIFGFDRMDHRFADTKNQQQNLAENLMKDLCPECQKKPFEKINDIFSYDMPTRHSRMDETKMNQEDQKAQEFLKQYFEKIYPGKVND